MATGMTLDEFEAVRGKAVYSADGDKIGNVEEVFVDEKTNRPRWLGLGTGFFGTKRVLVPVEGASMREGGVLVPYSKDKVKDTPDIDDGELSSETQQQLYAYYGVGRGSSVDTGGSNDDEASVTRSEEELQVGKREAEVGRLRLHKWTETEQVEVPVEVKREKARVTREPVDGTADAEEIGDESLEVTLHEERPVVQKETVAKERIGIEKDVETDTETVSESLRKERVNVDGDDIA